MVKKRQSEDLDRALIAEFIDAWMPRVRAVGNVSGLMRESGVSRSTINRIIHDHDPHVGRGTYARLEKPLGLPAGTISAIGRHGIREAEHLGAPLDVLTWLSRKLGSSGAVGIAR